MKFNSQTCTIKLEPETADKRYEIIKLERPRVNKCESCDRFEECYHYPNMKNLCDKENMGDVYYVRTKK